MSRDGWFPTTIGAQVKLQRGFDITKIAQTDGSVPVVSSGGIFSYHNEARAKGPGVIIARKGNSIGRVQYVTSDYWPHDTTLWVTDFCGNEPRFVHYFFSYCYSTLAGLDVGSANPTLNRNHVHPIEVMWPVHNEQLEITRMLGSLDDKIEQNRRTGAKLEGLARAVFKAWFVDFEPVKAKAAGATAFPGMPRETFAALPTRFEDSDLGPVPQEWTPRSLYSAAKFINGAAFKNSHFCEPSLGLPVVKIAELKSGVTDQTKYSNRTDLDARYNIDTGDLLYSWSGSPDTSLDTFIWTKGPGLLNQHIFRVVTESDARKTFVYYLLKHLKQDLIEIARNKQTTGLGHVTVGDMQRLLLAWPNGDVIEAFHQVTGPVFALSFNGLMETEKLAALRDYLLPRLLSGRVRVGAVSCSPEEMEVL